MNITCKGVMTPEWTLTEDSVFINGKEISLFSVRCVDHTPLKNGKSTIFQQNGSISLTYGPGSFDFVVLAYSGQFNEDGELAAKYIKEYVKEAKKIKDKEIKMRCKVCGKIFCYTHKDLEKNISLARSAMGDGLLTVLSGLSGNITAGAINSQSSDNKLNRIVDYGKCPSCGSKDLENISDMDLEETNTPAPAAVSSADELKKFKDLLDSGIITQEEFNAKKKQLLGL